MRWLALVLWTVWVSSNSFAGEAQGVSQALAESIERSYGIHVRAKAIEWADRHIVHIDRISQDQKIPLYYGISVFYDRISRYVSPSPFYRQLYADPLFRKTYPDQFPDSKTGIDIVLMMDGERVSDFEPYQQFAGMEVKDVWKLAGYVGDNRRIEDLEAVGGRQYLYMQHRNLTDRPTGTYNMFYHELGHTVQFTLLTEAEYEKVEELFQHAKKHGLCLDSYAANNSTEYFATGVEAYLSETKEPGLFSGHAHSSSRLRQKDPQLNDFIARLIGRKN